MNLTLPAGLTFATAPTIAVANPADQPLTGDKPGYLSVDLDGYQRTLLMGTQDGKGKPVASRDGALSISDIDGRRQREETLLNVMSQLSAMMNLGEPYGSGSYGFEVR